MKWETDSKRRKSVHESTQGMCRVVTKRNSEWVHNLHCWFSESFYMKLKNYFSSSNHSLTSDLPLSYWLPCHCTRIPKPRNFRRKKSDILRYLVIVYMFHFVATNASLNFEVVLHYFASVAKVGYFKSKCHRKITLVSDLNCHCVQAIKFQPRFFKFNG